MLQSRLMLQLVWVGSNSFLASGDFCRLFANLFIQFGLKSGQTKNGPELDLNFETWMVHVQCIPEKF